MYSTGHVDPWWDDTFKSLDFTYYPLKNTNDFNRWVSEGYQNFNLNGGLYDMRRPLPDSLTKFLSMFDWDNPSIGFYRMLTGDIMPIHQDHYIAYSKIFNITDCTKIMRAVVFLENWKSGHYFEIDGTPIINWHAGDYVVWNYDTPHMAANIGIQPRYTLQITGVLQ